MGFNSFLKKIAPPLFVDGYRKLFNKKYGFKGGFSSWEQARVACEGYADNHLFEKVRAAALEVKAGNYFCERDSVLFDSPQYSWSSLACLMNVAAREGGRLSVLDFGGSLGSTYFLNRRFLEGLDSEWSVVEQSHFVEVGALEIAEGSLRFYPDIDSCFMDRNPNVLLLSSVIQYLADPWQALDEFISRGWKYIVIDRTPFNSTGRNLLKVQYVDPFIYTASYPAWILDEGAIIRFFTEKGYQLIESFESTIDEFGSDIQVKGFFLEKIIT